MVQARQTIRQCVGLLDPRDRRKLGLGTFAQMATSLMDLAGVLLLGLVGSLAVALVQGQPIPPTSELVAELLGLEDGTAAQILGIFTIAAAVLLLGKSIVSSLLMRRIFRFLANRQAALSAGLVSKLMRQRIDFIQERSSQETAFALVQGATAATILVLGQTVVALSELTLLAVIATGLLLVNPYVAVVSIAYFAAVAWGLQLLLGRWAAHVGGVASRADIATYDAVQESMSAFRELAVVNRQGHYIERITRLRREAASALGDMQFMGTLSKYVFEAALVLGGFLLAFALIWTQPIEAAIGTLTLFVAAATRIMPSLLRLQLAALNIKNAAGLVAPTISLAESLSANRDNAIEAHVRDLAIIEEVDDKFEAGLSIQTLNVSFEYQGSRAKALDNVSISAHGGTSVGLVGKSGAGKSTLADIILGVLEPTSGQVLLGGRSPRQIISGWPGHLAYVPQQAATVNSTIRQNVALGIDEELIDETLVWDALEMAGLKPFVSSLPSGLFTQLGERGQRLSGGQRQRLGIARALYVRPRLLVLDEATSALDAETELAISETVRSLSGVVTTVIIAHRLSTVRHVDLLVYLQEGKVLGSGTFEDVRRTVPQLDRQASILGIEPSK